MSGLYSCRFETPIGILGISADENGITAIVFDGENLQGDDNIYLKNARAQLSEYFSGKRRSFDIPLSLKGTGFQQKVWRELMKIPYGETRSYSSIAEAIGNPRAVRAVGMANNRNPVPIIIPCHRVVGKDGSLVGYAGGLEIKKYLIELEK